MTLGTDHGSAIVRLGELVATVDHDLRASAADPGLRIAVSDRQGTRLLEDSYRFPDGALPQNHPAPGHGFTGLSYVTPSDGTGELQFSCVVARPDDERVDGWPIGRPGPTAAAGSHVVCDFSLEEPGLAARRNRIDLSDPRTAQPGPGRSTTASATLGPFEVSVTHMPGRTDAGAAIIDVAHGEAGARAFYQTNERELPAAFATADQGFSGKRVHQAPNGARLAYACHAQN